MFRMLRRAAPLITMVLVALSASACGAGGPAETAAVQPVADAEPTAVQKPEPTQLAEVDSRWTKYIEPEVRPAPELVSITGWHNTNPFSLESKRGQVVMVKFWTFGCYNCVNTMPYVNAWHDKYADEGLLIVGVHYPEFDFERDLEAVIASSAERGLEYPIAQDNTGATWRAYENRYWPTMYLIDKNGNIRYTHIGEGAYDETERKIQQLLSEPGPV